MLKQKTKIPISIKRGLLLGISLAVLVFGIASFVVQQKTTLAATNSTINFQARLLTAAGNVVPDGLYNVEFKLYAAAENGTALWTETRTDGNKVTVKNGYLTVNLGSVNGLADENINWDQELWLTMNIGGTGSPSWDGEMNPRLKLTSVPYAFRSGAVVSADGTSVLTAANGESGTICVRNSVNCGFILNQSGSTQTANFRIGGTGRADTALLSPALDVATAGALSIGTSTATSIVLGSNANNTAIALQSGTGTIDIGTGAQTRSINIGTGGAPQQVTIGSAHTTSSTIINGGTGGIRLETSGQDAQVAVRSQTNSAIAFRVLNAAEIPVFNVDTTSPNLISNSSFESGRDATGLEGWSAHGGAAAPVTTVMAHYDNDNALEITTAGAGQGAKYNYALKPSTQYSLSMFVRPVGASVSTLEIGYSGNGSTDTSCAAGEDIEVWPTSWTRIRCTFTTGSVSGTTYVYIKQTDATGRTLYLDAVQLEEAAAATSYRNSTVAIGSSLAINSGPLDAKAANAALLVRALHSGHGLILKGSGSSSIFNNLLDIQVPDPILTQSDVSLLRVNEPARTTYVRGGSSFFNTPALDVASTDDNATAVKIAGRNGGNAPLLLLQGASSPGAAADFIKVQNAANVMMFKVDNDGDAMLARNLYLGADGDTNVWIGEEGNTNSDVLVMSGSSGAKVRVGGQDVASFSTTGTNLAGSLAVQTSNGNTSTAFRVLAQDGTALFNVDTSGDRVRIGADSDDSTGTLFLLDTKNTAGDPTGVNGAMYYNSNSGEFRCYQAGAWYSCMDTLSASAYTRATNSTAWVELERRSVGTGWLSTPDRLEIEVSGGDYFGDGTTIYYVEFRDSIVVKRRDYNGGADPALHTLKIYSDDAKAAAAVDKHVVGFSLGSGATFHSINIRARELGSGQWLKVREATEPSTGYTNVTPTIGYGAFAAGAATFRNAGNSATAFQIQNASGAGVLTVDTTTGAVGIGGAPGTGSKLDVLQGDTASTYIRRGTGQYLEFRTVASGNAIMGFSDAGNPKYTIIGVDANGQGITLNTGVTTSSTGTVRLHVDNATGNVGIGTSTNTADEKLEVVGNLKVSDSATSPTKTFRVRTNGSTIDVESGVNMHFSTWTNAGMTTSQMTHVIMHTTGQMTFPSIGTIAASIRNLCIDASTKQVLMSTSGTNCSTSSERYKQNIQDMSDSMGLEAIMALRPVTFNYNSGSDTRQKIGFIAEDMDVVLPGLVEYDELGRPNAINYEYLTANLAKAIQQQQVQIDDLRTGLWSGGLVSDDTTFNSLVTFNSNVVFNGAAVFKGTVSFNGKITYSRDAAGVVVIPEGQTTATVTFSQPYDYVPHVVATSSEFIDVRIIDKTADGFTVEIRNALGEDVNIDWIANQVVAGDP